MELIAYIIGLSALALACAAVASWQCDDFALRVAARLIARTEARRSFRQRYAQVLAEREAEFELPKLMLQRGEVRE